VPLPAEVGDVYAGVKVAQQLKGPSLDENDLWIASAAKHFGATLVSRDRDFTRIDALDVVDWSADEKMA
jgi:predicted nucleic acid-binding protein